MIYSSRLIAVSAAAAMTAVTFAGPAFSKDAPAYETRIAVISTSGLDLRTENGAAALNNRIRSAASTLCGTPAMDEPAELIAAHSCRVKAVAATQPQVQAAIASAIRSAQVSAPSPVQVSSADR